MKNRKGILRFIVCIVSVCVLLAGLHPAMAFAAEEKGTERAEEILAGMSLDEKVSQMIVPAIRTWNGENVTDLSKTPELAEALRKHPYGGIILYGANVSDTGQVTRLIADLQANNAAIEPVSAHIPYLMPVDEEGGIVTRLTTGTRMTGSMAIGATGKDAEDFARKTGEVIGEELAAVGFNADCAPDIDVNNNAANPVIGTRAFSDDPQIVAQLGKAYKDGLDKNHIIAIYKHYTGHGDTGIDSHIGTPSVEKTYEQLKEMELIPFEAAIADGADMIMTAHITYPLIDEEVVFGDGVTKGYYPATMSKKMISEILRHDLGFNGVVVTDALEMDAITAAGLVLVGEDPIEYSVNIAQEVINADVDILLLPLDMNCAEAVLAYDAYIEGLKAKVEEGAITQEQIDDSVLRILKLKEKYGILDTAVTADGINETIQRALQVVGSDAHHEIEMDIAKKAVTMVKNDDKTLPLEGTGKKIVFIGRQADDSKTILHTIRQLQQQGRIDPDAQIVDLVHNEKTGSEDAKTRITLDFYFDPDGGETKLHYTDALKQAVAEADTVICLSKTSSLSAMGTDNDQYRGISGAIADAHAAGAKAILLSDNLPYDAARYQDADAILLAYMGSGLDMDPTARADGSANLKAYNANVIAAIHILFGDGSPVGTLPVNIPAIAVQDNGSLTYTADTLYKRGHGLTY